MSTPSEITRSQQQTGLVKLSKDVILKEQDSNEVIKRIARAVNRLGKLFQVPNWSEESAVILAEWIYSNYKWESLEAVEECLSNPPVSNDPTWRLTPDTIQKWMTVQLEKEAIKREKENEKLKLDFKEELPNIDYASYKKRIENGEALKEESPARKSGFEGEGYQAFKNDWIKKRLTDKNPTI